MEIGLLEARLTDWSAPPLSVPGFSVAFVGAESPKKQERGQARKEARHRATRQPASKAHCAMFQPCDPPHPPLPRPLLLWRWHHRPPAVENAQLRYGRRVRVEIATGNAWEACCLRFGGRGSKPVNRL